MAPNSTHLDYLKNVFFRFSLFQNRFYIFNFLTQQQWYFNMIYVSFCIDQLEQYVLQILSFGWLAEPKSNSNSKQDSAVKQKMMFCKEIVNIALKQTTSGLNKMYLQFLDDLEWISWGKQCNASKYFCATAEILLNCNPPREISECKIGEGYIIAAIGNWTQVLLWSTLPAL